MNYAVTKVNQSMSDFAKLSDFKIIQAYWFSDFEKVLVIFAASKLWSSLVFSKF